MRKTRLMPIIPMAYGGNVSSKGLVRRRLFQGGNPSASTSGTDPVDDNHGWGTDEELGIAPKAKGPGTDWMGLIGRASDAVLPFASNIVNAMRTPPQPNSPRLLNPVVLSRIRLDASRQQVRNASRAQDLNADRSLDEQSAAAVRSSNLAKSLNQEGQISEQEGFLNARQRAEAAGMNLNVDAMNTSAINKQGDERVARQLAIQREQSQNLANATDKYIGMGNERAKAQLDLQKLQTLSQMWKDSGVYDRLMKRIKSEGVKDPTGVYGQMGWLGDALGTVSEKAMGGTMSPMVSQNPHPARPHPLHRGAIGARKVMAFGSGEGPGTMTLKSALDAKSKGYDDASMADDLGMLLMTGNYPAGRVTSANQGLYDSAFIYRSQHAGASPEAMVNGYYGRPVDPNNPVDMMRGRLGKLNNDPVANLRESPNIQVRQALTTHAFGGYRTTLAKGYLSPFGNTRSIGMGPGIMHDKFNPKHISHVPHNMLAMGGAKTDGSGGDDITFTNHEDAAPYMYRDGGPWQEEWAHGGRLKPRTVDHSMWKQPYKENALTNNDPNPYQPSLAMGGEMAGEFSGETTARDMSMWNRKQWADGKDPGVDILKGGGWISKAVNPAHKGYCTPMTKSTCTPRRKAFAMTMKKHHGFHAMGGHLKPVYS